MDSFGSFGSYAVVEDRNLLPSSSLLSSSSRSKRASRLLIRGSQIRNVNVRLERSDPYGVLPLGCSLLDKGSSSSNSNTTNGLGRFQVLPEELLSYLFSFFDAQSLCRLSLSSKTFYAHVHGGGLQHFRELVIKELECTPSQYFSFEQDWKTSLALLSLKKKNLNGAEFPITKFSHKPILVQGVYSDLLFKHFVCANADISDSWYKDVNLTQIDGNVMNPSDFFTNYEEKNIPVLIRGSVSKWPAMSQWTDSGLIKRCPKSSLFHCGGVRLSMESYLQYVHQTSRRDDRPLYLFERHFLALGDEEMKNEFSVPPYFADDLQQLLEPFGLVPDYRWLIIGPRKSGSTFHKDPNASSAWNALIRGRKAWIFYPPESVPPGVVIGSNSDQSSEIATPASVMEWYIDCFAQHRSRLRKSRNPSIRNGDSRGPLCGIQEPGDVVFVPCGWWHQVLNLEDSVCVTHNFISPRNVQGALDIMRDDPGALSGFPNGREGEVYSAFISALENKRPEVLRREKIDEVAHEEKETRKKWSSATDLNTNFVFDF
jgi:hypothetical protein